MTAFFPTGGEVSIRSAIDPNGLRGEGLDFIVMDEAAYIDPAAWYEALRPTLADRLGRALFISTPNGRNWFWRLYMQDGDEWQAFTFPTAANPYIATTEIEAARLSLPEIIFRQEFLAEFIDSDGAVFRRVVEACTSVAIDEAQPDRQYTIAVDVAQSVDYTVACVMDVEARAQVAMDRFSRVDYPVLEDRLMAIYNRFKAERMRVEANGIGAPVIDHLREMGLNIESFTTTNATKGTIIQGLMGALEHNNIVILDDETQKNELLSFESKRSQSGAITYSAPDGLHDDTVMALAMAWDMIDNGGWTIA